MHHRWVKRLLPAFETRERLRRAAWWPVDCLEGGLGLRSPFVAPRGLRFVGGTPALALREYRDFYFPLARLAPADCVLDVGSGVGYLAMALLLQEGFRGPYLGFDIVRFAVEWCQRKISSRHPSYRFVHADLFNRQYNPAGTVPAAQFRFPCEDASQDVVFLKSIVTHMMPAEVQRYLREIRRVLRPGGRCVFSAFLPAREDAGSAAPKPAIPFQWTGGEYAVYDPQIPEAAIGFAESALRDWVGAANLAITATQYGAWRGSGHDRHFQDLICCVPA